MWDLKHNAQKNLSVEGNPNIDIARLLASKYLISRNLYVYIYSHKYNKKIFIIITIFFIASIYKINIKIQMFSKCWCPSATTSSQSSGVSPRRPGAWCRAAPGRAGGTPRGRSSGSCPPPCSAWHGGVVFAASDIWLYSPVQQLRPDRIAQLVIVAMHQKEWSPVNLFKMSSVK